MMRPGLEGTSGRDYGAWVTSRNWVQHALARPMFAAPGEEMEYSTGNTHLLSAILTTATGKSTLQFANEVLAKPLGFALAPWPRDPQGVYFGGNDMLMTPRQMLAFGELYRTKGRANGQQILSADWVDRSCEGRARNRRPGNPAFDPNGGIDPMRDRRYGYGWWVHQIGDYEACFAWGYGGQVHLRPSGLGPRARHDVFAGCERRAPRSPANDIRNTRTARRRADGRLGCHPLARFSIRRSAEASASA